MFAIVSHRSMTKRARASNSEDCSMKQEVKIIKGPDGFYAGRILKSGLPSSDTHKVSDEEVCAMFEDVLRRHRAETGHSVLSIFNERKEPIFVAKLDPDIRECGVL